MLKVPTMKTISYSLVVCSALLVMASADAARAEVPITYADWVHSAAHRRASRSSWHGDYYHSQWGRPVAMAVPPTASMQSSYAWGVAQTRRTPVYHQFDAEFPGYGVAPRQFWPTPLWPSSTNQFGVYHVRGPW